MSGPGTIACDIGPSFTGSIPAAAAQAGFNHCAANYDFTQTQQWTDIRGTHQWTNLSSWLSCSNTSTTPYLFYFVGTVACDSSHITVGPDPGHGNVQALIMSYYLTDKNAALWVNQIQTLGPPSASDPQNAMPEEYYLEQVLRPNSTTCSTTGFCLYWDISTFTSIFGNPCFVSSDMSEFDGGATGTGIGMPLWNANCGSGSGGGVGFTTSANSTISTSTGTFGALVTADNVSAFGGCNYWGAGNVAGLPASAWKSCLNQSSSDTGATLNNGVMTVVPPSTNPVFHNGMYLYWVEGPQNSYAGTNWTVASHTTYIERVTVWECAAWPQQCYTNPVITTHP